MTTMIDGVFRPGDRVEFKGIDGEAGTDLGHLQPGDSGIVVEVYPEGQGDISHLPFPVAVAWPTLRRFMPEDSGPQIMEGLEAHNLHEGDVVPMMASELKVTGNVYAEGH